MTNNTAPDALEGSPVIGRPRALQTILFGGLTVGVLDALDAMIFFGSQGVSPTHIFQQIASGLLGSASFQGGTRTVILGVFLHFVVATCIATVFYLASRIFPFLIRRPVVWGMIFGLVAYFVMSYVVVPLSAASQGRFSWPVFLNGIIGHALLVGLPIALIAHRTAKSRG